MKFIIEFLTIFYLIGIIIAQEADSVQTALPDDSSLNDVEFISDSLAEDTLNTVKKEPLPDAEYDLIWQNFQITGNLYEQASPEQYFQFDNLKNINYTGMADIFRHNSEFQIYDFFSFGYPRFVAQYNLFPHQSGIYLNGYVLNDPINGMFNTHMVSLDGLAEVNNNTGMTTYGYNNGINLKTRALMSDEEPYSRVMFRQGDFGYTDLDISFSRKFSNNISLNLGGINKIYQSQGNHGFQYRGGLYVRLSDKIFSQTILNLDRERIINSNFSAFPFYSYHEFRHDYNSSIYYVPDSDKSERWKLNAGYTRIRGLNQSSGDSATAFFNRRRADQYSISLDRNIMLDSINADVSIAGYQTRIWGSSFNGKLIDSGLNGCMGINYPLQKRVTLDGSLKAGYLYGEDINWSPELGIKFNFDPLSLYLQGSHLQRYPYRNERSMDFGRYEGNRNLNSETLKSISAELSYIPFNNLNLNTKITTSEIDDEILFDGSTFRNGPDRKFSYIHLSAGYSLYKFVLAIDGQITNTDINISPKRSFSGQLRYHDRWLKGAIVIDAVGNFHWYDTHNAIFYNPVVQRFYWSDRQTDGYYYYSYKITATVKDAQIYMAMDNPMSYDYQYINGYYEFYRRVRFGVNWVLFD